MAVGLVLTTTLVTLPVSASDLSSPKPVLGSVSVVGLVEVRGVLISQEGTLFPGDSIRSREKGYAKILFGSGSKVELAEKTDINVNPDSQGVKIAMNTGNVGFTARTSLRIGVQPFEVLATDGASGNVAIMNPTTAGVRALNGKVTVRNLKTSESFVLQKGQERFLGLKDGKQHASLADIASTVPVPIPAPKPQTPAGKTGGGLALDTGGWLAIAAAGAVTAVAIWGLVVAKSNHDDIEKLNSQLAANQAALAANQAATANALVAISNAVALLATASQVQAAGSQVATASAQTSTAIANSNLSAAAKANLQAQATPIINSANQAAATAASLSSQIQALQATISASGTATTAQLSQLATLQSQLDSARVQINNSIIALGALITSANQQGANVPVIQIQQVAAPQTASKS